jgi:hypothetical protein
MLLVTTHPKHPSTHELLPKQRGPIISGRSVSMVLQQIVRSPTAQLLTRVSPSLADIPSLSTQLNVDANESDRCGAPPS